MAHKENRVWTREEIAAYLSGTMADADRHAIEIDMLNDPFLEDAIEGFSDNPEAIGSESLDTKWDERQASKGGPAKASQSRASTLWAILAGLGLVALLIYSAEQRDRVGDLAEAVASAQAEDKAVARQYKDSLEVMEIELSQEVPEREQIKAVTMRADMTRMSEQAPTVAQYEISEAPAEIEAERERIEAPEVLGSREVDTISEVQGSAKLAEKPLPVFYINDLKIADHRQDHVDEVFLRTDLLSGTRATFEDRGVRVEQTGAIEQLTYTDVLGEAISHYDQGDYRTAAVLLKRLENKHPDDSNAAFYGGLCYYNLGKWKQASLRFRRAMRHPMRVFDQEGQWYLAQTLLQMERDADAQRLLKDIVSARGFYADRALDLLEQD